MESLRLDLRYAVRTLVRRPGFTALAVLTLAIGIGVNTIAFSALNALLFKPFRFAGAETLGWVMTRSPGNPYGSTSWPDYLDLTRSVRTFEALAAEGRLPLSMRNDGRPAEQIWGLLVSANYLSVLRARPAAGRIFTPEDLRGTDIPAVVSHRFWTSRLDADPSLANRTLTLNGRIVSVVGVLRDDFQGPGGLFEPDVWVPLERMDVLGTPAERQARRAPWLSLVGRTRPDVTPAQAEADLRAAGLRLAGEYPDTNRERTFTFAPMRDGHPDIRGIARMSWMALGVVGLVLLIACFNVAGLLLARASERQREIGVRAALGASRGRILRQLITEGTVLAALSGAASLVLAAWSADLLSVFSLPSPIPQRLHIGVDTRLVVFTALLVAIAGVLPALAPALQATRASLVRSMRHDAAAGGRRSRTQNLFVIAQVAGSTLFLAGALLFVRSFLNSARFDFGFDTAHVLTLDLTPSTFGYDAPRTRVLMDTLALRVAALPGVTHVAIADRVPFYIGFPKATPVSVDGTNCATADCRRVGLYAVGRGHFDALGMRFVAGRDFTDADVKNGGVVILSETAASRLWPGHAAIGQWMKEGSDGRQVQVVGVVSDIKHRNATEAAQAYLYRPIRTDDFADAITLVVRTAGDPRSLLAAVQDQVPALDPDLPARTGKTMEQRMEVPLWPQRTAAGFFLVCGTLALVLATIGLFGVTYYAVSQRTREFGIRAALGATRASVVRLVVRDGLRLTVPGLALGICAALAGARIVSRGLFGISAADPATYALTAGLQGLVALVACALPAYRATRADPIAALRQE